MSTRWKTGQSGNPKGRPPGLANVTKYRQAIADELPEVLRIVLDAAKAADLNACRIVLERVLPAMKPIEQPVAIELPQGTLTGQGEAVMLAAGAGAITPQQAGALLSGLGTLAKLKEADELERRIMVLEAATRNGNKEGGEKWQ